ncbi:response regulator [Lederbergia galactosidilytica]|uniref:Response regulator n=1 Tax=Lederbergia galactosidilytica TaxID=217031 RepID=A0A177ZKN5_9BACI|nr:response regulator [Lederbergia galactosidilytica]MBP1916809.1 two-component system response regulator YesN [Lederbergia galactosidilytica]OAK68512.1 hypothetical protein ABB05_15670 [Lederbergia galactosidilytica]
MVMLLIVDDEAWVRDTIKTLVTQDSSPLNDVHIKEAKNGIEALDFLKQTKPDLMITDMKMPGIDGKKLLEIIEKEYQDLPIIVLSGYHDFIYTKQAIKSRVIEYLLKPINHLELYQALEKALELSRKRKESEIHYHLFSMSRPEMNDIIQPFLRSLFFHIKEANKEEFIKNMNHFISLHGDSLKGDEAFLAHWQRKFIEMIEEIMQEYQLRLEDFKVKPELFQIELSLLEKIVEKQMKIGHAVIFTISENKKQKHRLNLKETKLFIEQRYDSPDLSLDIVAKNFFVSKEYLTTVFKKQYGQNITEYIISLRMKKAKELVENTTMQYKLIAEKVGYEDISYFYRVFKKFYHMSPGEMRK